MGGGHQYPWQWETLGDIMWDGEEKAMHNQQTTSFFKVLGWHPIFLYMYSTSVSCKYSAVLLYIHDKHTISTCNTLFSYMYFL